MSDASCNDPVGIFARKLMAIRTVVRIMRGPIGIPLERDRRNGDLRQFCKPGLEVGIFCFAINQAKTEPVIVNHNGSVVRIVERFGSALERHIIKGPLWRSDFPNKLPEIMPVLVITKSAATILAVRPPHY